MTLDLKESKELCDWLIQRGLGLVEAAEVLGCVECNHSLAEAITKVFQNRRERMEKINEKYHVDIYPGSTGFRV